jgi:hypothetical protein
MIEIERLKINGRDATVAYLTADMQPAEKEARDLVKVTFGVHALAPFVMRRRRND